MKPLLYSTFSTKDNSEFYMQWKRNYFASSFQCAGCTNKQNKHTQKKTFTYIMDVQINKIIVKKMMSLIWSLIFLTVSTFLPTFPNHLPHPVFSFCPPLSFSSPLASSSSSSVGSRQTKASTWWRSWLAGPKSRWSTSPHSRTYRQSHSGTNKTQGTRPFLLC